MEIIEIRVGFLNEWKPFVIGEQIFIFDFQKAIDIVRLSKMPNVQLRQNSNGSVMEWDNF